jgi:ADP-ribosylarginine hydrolase
MDKRFNAIMVLHALGDTIGFKNGDWEFNYHKDKFEVLDYVNELIYEFIDLGGVNGINLDGWLVSDDTFFHIAMAKSMLKYKNYPLEILILHIKDNLWDEAERMWHEASGKYKPDDPHNSESSNDSKNTNNFNRYIGITTSENIKKFTATFDARYDKYDPYAGGNGCAMRNLVIGMCLHGESVRDSLIELSVVSSQLTHNNALGYLAGFNAALFTALAIENIPIKKWGFILLNYLKSDKLKSFLSLDNLDQIYDHNVYIRYWRKYLDTKFDANEEPIRNRSYANPMHRIRYFYDNFFKEDISYQIGASGYLCMIMAYDAVLDCDGKWEKLIVYAMLHSGDSDTIGAVAGGLYGAVYGMGDVPSNMLKYLERKDELEKLGHDLYKKFGKN